MPIQPHKTLFFLCDVQTKFRPAIYGFEEVVATINKMLKIAKILNCEVVVTTQKARALGPIVPEIDLASLNSLHLATIDKTLFSMLTPQVMDILESRPNIDSIVLFGIEAHICVLQTALGLLSLPVPYTTYVIADGVSSNNAFEVPLALETLRQAGAVISTSESLAFQLMGDAERPAFKAFSTVVKEEKDNTKKSGDVLLQGGKKAFGLKSSM